MVKQPTSNSNFNSNSNLTAWFRNILIFSHKTWLLDFIISSFILRKLVYLISKYPLFDISAFLQNLTAWLLNFFVFFSNLGGLFSDSSKSSNIWLLKSFWKNLGFLQICDLSKKNWFLKHIKFLMEIKFLLKIKFYLKTQITLVTNLTLC